MDIDEKRSQGYTLPYNIIGKWIEVSFCVDTTSVEADAKNALQATPSLVPD